MPHPGGRAALAASWLAALVLGLLTWQVQAAAGPLAIDLRWAHAFDTLRSGRLDVFMRALHEAQGKLVAVALLGLAATMLHRRQWRALLLFMAAVPGGMLVNDGLKLLVARPRPALVDAMVGSHGFAYPSGHVAAITLFLGYLVVLTFQRTPRRRWRITACLGAAAVVAAVGASRVYLGVHLPSDVLAAFLFGLAWLGLCLRAAQALTGAQARASGAAPGNTMR